VLGPFDIVIQPGPGLAGNAAALAAWDHAAAEWEAIISDPVTVTVEADLVDLGEPGVLGQTDAVLLTRAVDEIRDPMAQSASYGGRAAGQGGNVREEAVVLPTLHSGSSRGWDSR
jgi:hypothetical protein